MTNKEVMQQALECIEHLNMRGFILADFEDKIYAAINSLKAALKQSEPPPEWEGINNVLSEYGLDAIAFVAEWKAAQRPWQGLTEENFVTINQSCLTKLQAAASAESILKERNT